MRAASKRQRQQQLEEATLKPATRAPASWHSGGGGCLISRALQQKAICLQAAMLSSGAARGLHFAAFACHAPPCPSHRKKSLEAPVVALEELAHGHMQALTSFSPSCTPLLPCHLQANKSFLLRASAGQPPPPQRSATSALGLARLGQGGAYFLKLGEVSVALLQQRAGGRS